MDKISDELEDFLFIAIRYVREYARSKMEVSTIEQPQKRFGHANDILGAIRLRKSFTEALIRAYDKLSANDKADGQIQTAFWLGYNKYEQGSWLGYDRKLVGTLLSESISLANAQSEAVVLVTERFAIDPTRPEQRYYGHNKQFDAFTYCG